MPYLRGRVEHVVHNSDTFYVLSFQVDETDAVYRPRSTKISGNLFGLSRLVYGTTIQIDGEWITHQKYGRQFTAHGWHPWARTPKDVERFLVECVDVFSDKAVLQQFVLRYELGAYNVLMEDPGEESPELKSAKVRWRAIRGIAMLADSLRGYNLGTTAISEIYRKFGATALAIIGENPYRLLEIEGFPFVKADTVALGQSISASDPRRVAGAVLWVLREQIRQQGHLYLARGDLVGLLHNLESELRLPSFGASVDLAVRVENAVHTLAEHNAVVLDHEVGVYTPETYHYERVSAILLSKFLQSSTELIIDVVEFLRLYESANGIQLSDLQREAVSNLIANRVLVVTGAPGTGKTTLIRAFVQLFQNIKTTVQLMAPTGIAAKRLASVTEVGAQTIHRALGYDGFYWERDSTNKLNTQAVIVDEASMVDQELFYRLLNALDPTTMLVIVGDDAQLPSVGAGNVLRELLSCPAIQHVRLDQIFRQAETSDIVLAAHEIRKGRSPLGVSKKEDTEFKFLGFDDNETLASFIVEMAAKLKERDSNFQILSPKYDGVVGVDNLNRLLKERLNPNQGQSEWAVAFGSNGQRLEVRVGDRLMVIKNNYQLNVSNGDIGKLISIHKDFLRIRIHGIGKIPDSSVDVPKNVAPLMLKLAYAVTVHRCQGEEFETVIFPLVREHGRMLQRNLFYTAITRARSKVWVLGDTESVAKAVSNDKVVQRNTQLRHLITQGLRVAHQAKKD